ncbi:MAG: DUF429 domain-containing protein [Methylomicrobium sp.]
MTMVAGADGYQGGWVLAIQDTITKSLSWDVVPTISEVFHRHPDVQLLAIDIPIGLLERGSRECDVLVRRHLGAIRGSSVFPAPIRPLLNARSHAEASQLGKRIEGRGLSIQSWAIVPKIREVDEFLRQHPYYRQIMREVHPEVSFSILHDAPILAPKSKALGCNIRRDLLISAFGSSVCEAERDCKIHGAKSDDVLDAFIALWSAERIRQGKHVSFPSNTRPDSFGLRMEILA